MSCLLWVMKKSGLLLPCSIEDSSCTAWKEKKPTAPTLSDLLGFGRWGVKHWKRWQQHRRVTKAMGTCNCCTQETMAERLHLCSLRKRAMVVRSRCSPSLFQRISSNFYLGLWPLSLSKLFCCVCFRFSREVFLHIFTLGLWHYGRPLSDWEIEAAWPEPLTKVSCAVLMCTVAEEWTSKSENTSLWRLGLGKLSPHSKPYFGSCFLLRSKVCKQIMHGTQFLKVKCNVHQNARSLTYHTLPHHRSGLKFCKLM